MAKDMLVARFKLERETKGALRYAELSSDGKMQTPSSEGVLIGTLYLRKAKMALGAKNAHGNMVWPEEINVMIEVAD